MYSLQSLSPAIDDGPEGKWTIGFPPPGLELTAPPDVPNDAIIGFPDTDIRDVIGKSPSSIRILRMKLKIESQIILDLVLFLFIFNAH